jgi:hypothetical protein
MRVNISPWRARRYIRKPSWFIPICDSVTFRCQDASQPTWLASQIAYSWIGTLKRRPNCLMNARLVSRGTAHAAQLSAPRLLMLKVTNMSVVIHFDNRSWRPERISQYSYYWHLLANLGTVTELMAACSFASVGLFGIHPCRLPENKGPYGIWYNRKTLYSFAH